MATLHTWAVRRISYPLWQWREGGRGLPILASMRASQWLTPEALETLQFQRLRALIAHAPARPPFYRAAFSQAGVAPEDIRTLSDLRHLPVLRKVDLRDRSAEIITRPRAGLVRRQTGGSTGIPLGPWAEAH